MFTPKVLKNNYYYYKMENDWYGKIRKKKKKAVMCPGEFNTLLSYF